MSPFHPLRDFIRERLTAAAEEIFTEVEKTIVRYEEELHVQRRMMEENCRKPEKKLSRIGVEQQEQSSDFQKPQVSGEEGDSAFQQIWKQGRRSGEDQQEPEPAWVKEEEEDLEPSLIIVQEEPETEWIKVEEEEPEPAAMEEENDELGFSWTKEECMEPELPLGEKRKEPETEQIKDKEETENQLIDEVMEEPEDLLTSRNQKDLHSSQQQPTAGTSAHQEGPAMATFITSSDPQDEDLWDLVKNRGIPMEAFDERRKDHTYSSVIGRFDDCATAAYVPAYGERTGTKCFWLDKQRGGRNDQRRLSLFEKLREKTRPNGNQVSRYLTDEENSLQTTKWYLKNNKRASKMTRKVELGWIHERRQVRKRGGGGTTVLDISKKATKTDILSHARKLFFPDDRSSRGTWDDFSHDVVDFKVRRLDDNVSVGQLYEMQKLGIIRLYLLTMDLNRKPSGTKRTRDGTGEPAEPGPQQTGPAHLDVPRQGIDY